MAQTEHVEHNFKLINYFLFLITPTQMADGHTDTQTHTHKKGVRDSESAKARPRVKTKFSVLEYDLDFPFVSCVQHHMMLTVNGWNQFTSESTATENLLNVLKRREVCHDRRIGGGSHRNSPCGLISRVHEHIPVPTHSNELLRRSLHELKLNSLGC